MKTYQCPKVELFEFETESFLTTEHRTNSLCGSQIHITTGPNISLSDATFNPPWKFTLFYKYNTHP